MNARQRQDVYQEQHTFQQMLISSIHLWLVNNQNEECKTSEHKNQGHHTRSPLSRVKSVRVVLHIHHVPVQTTVLHISNYLDISVAYVIVSAYLHGNTNSSRTSFLGNTNNSRTGL